MSLTSYRAAPPRDEWWSLGIVYRMREFEFLLGRPGGDLLSRVLGRSTIGAEGFHGRVRDGIGCIAPRNDHQVIQEESSWMSIQHRAGGGARLVHDARVDEVANCAELYCTPDFIRVLIAACDG